jgi:outer membrane lipoprotein carrier protein
MNRYTLPALLSLTLALTSDVKTLLDRVASRYSDGSAHGAAFSQTYTPAGFATARRESGTVWIQAPQRLRFDYSSPEKKIFTYDGGEGRLYTPEDHQLTIRKLTPEDRARLPIVFLSDPAELERRYNITLEPMEAGAARLLLTPRSPDPDLAWLRVTLAADGSITSLAYEDASGSRSEFRFEAWRREKPRPPTDFRITGPPGTRILEN